MVSSPLFIIPEPTSILFLIRALLWERDCQKKKVAATGRNRCKQKDKYEATRNQSTGDKSLDFCVCGGGILRPNRSVVEKRNVIEIVEITPFRQSVAIQDPARSEYRSQYQAPDKLPYHIACHIFIFR